MSQISSLSQAIEAAATQSPTRRFAFVKNDQWDLSAHPFAMLEVVTGRIAGSLQAAGLHKGDRVALVIPDNEAFVMTFLSCLRAGIIPVPLYPPTGVGQLAGYMDNTRHVLNQSGARMMVTVPMIAEHLAAVKTVCPSLEQLLSVSDLFQGTAALTPVEIKADDVAFLQYTSGSTSRPKGVTLTHANLLANIHALMGEGLGAHQDKDHGVSWLPLFHDMGLIGFVLAPLVYQVDVTFLSTLQFLKRPSVWLKAMSKYKGTISFGPNFAYGLCARRIRAEECDGVDLSAWRVAGCGSEPIRPEILQGFAKAFGPLGFRSEAFLPAYGMAENSLAICFSTGIPIDEVKASSLWNNGIAQAAPGATEDLLRLVSCGKAFKGHDVGVFKLEDTLSKNRLGEREVGELRLKGPSVCVGYFNDPELTKSSYAGEWFKTGDLGYMVNGEVYICGRAKEVIIVNGRNFYPQDIEWEANQVEGVTKGHAIAFGAPSADGAREQVVVVVETDLTDDDSRKRMAMEIKQRVTGRGLILDDVILLAPGSLPKTSSGKLQRVKSRDLFMQGQLGVSTAPVADNAAGMAAYKLSVLGKS